MARLSINETEIRKTITALKPNGELFEVRLIDGKWNASGYFKDVESVIRELKKFAYKENANVYITINGVDNACFSRKQHNKLIEYATPTTSDNDIGGFNWLMIDLDPKRAAGTSSSDEQIEKAKDKARKIYKFLQNRLWEAPVVAMSGNGVHLLYCIKLINSKENVELLKNVLLALNMIFSDNDIDVDLKTFNPARICKLYGTMAKKGANTDERPHRMSYIVSMPDEIKVNDIEQLKRLTEILPKEEKPERYNNYNPKAFNLEKWINDNKLNVKRVENWNGGKKYVLEECVFNSSHRGKDACIIQTSDGKICYNCFHNSCAGNHWKELRQLFEPDVYNKKFIDEKPRPNYKNENYVIEKVEVIKEVDGKPIFYTTEQIRLLETPPEEFIKTGITVFDKKLRGLKKGFVTCLSGLRACGKSSIISQISLQAVEQGYKAALFSGELTATNTLKWLMLQAAGKNNVVSTQYENFYTVKDATAEKISKWLNEKVYIYNNDYGNDFEQIEENLMQCVVTHKIDLIILDNLMALNISGLTGQDKYSRQSQFVERLEIFAKKCNVHIIFVAHPRKSQGFLRLDDVSGSNDIVNRVDNAVIMHRVNEDFKRLSAEMFRWSANNALYQCQNVIEIAKDRDGGVQDEFIPLYFERESKRLKNNQYENMYYSWETQEIVCDAICNLPN